MQFFHLLPLLILLANLNTAHMPLEKQYLIKGQILARNKQLHTAHYDSTVTATLAYKAFHQQALDRMPMLQLKCYAPSTVATNTTPPAKRLKKRGKPGRASGSRCKNQYPCGRPTINGCEALIGIATSATELA